MSQNKYDSIMEKIGYRHVRDDEWSAPSMEAISAFEKKLGYELPADYKEFLLKYGVTGSEKGYWRIRDQDGGLEGGVDVFHGISPRSRYYNLEEYIDYDEDLPPQYLPIASANGGNLVVSLAGNDRGGIYWWHQEDGLILNAPDFDSFMRMIVAEPKNA